MALDIGQIQESNKTKSQVRSWNFNVSLFETSNVSSKDRIFLFQQIQLLLETGTPLHTGLTALAKHSEKSGIKNLLEKVIEYIDEGKSFSFALSNFPEIFNSTHINLISAGEEGGYLDKVLQQIVEMEEKREKLKETLLSALSYPLFLMIFSFGVIVFILVIVFPKFEELFSKIHDHLPATTKFLMWTSDALIHQWPIILFSITGLIVLIYLWIRSEKGEYFFDKIKLSLPLLSHIYTQIYLVQSLRVMYLSLNNGVTIVDTLRSCKHSVKNRVYRDFLTNVEVMVQEGSGISNGFSQAEFVPPLVKQMISTGEESGKLPTVMGKVADHYEDELLKHLKTLSKLAEPIMLVVMGAIVGIIVSSLILPIFMLSRVVN